VGPEKLNNIEQLGCKSGTQSDLSHFKRASSADATHGRSRSWVCQGVEIAVKWLFVIWCELLELTWIYYIYLADEKLCELLWKHKRHKRWLLDTPGPTLGPGNLPRTEHEVARPWDVSRDDGLMHQKSPEITRNRIRMHLNLLDPPGSWPGCSWSTPAHRLRSCQGAVGCPAVRDPRSTSSCPWYTLHQAFLVMSCHVHTFFRYYMILWCFRIWKFVILLECFRML